MARGEKKGGLSFLTKKRWAMNSMTMITEIRSAEQKERDEQRKTMEAMIELEKERDLQALRRSGLGNDATERLEWMYQVPGVHGAKGGGDSGGGPMSGGTEEQNEAFLLGKKKDIVAGGIGLKQQLQPTQDSNSNNQEFSNAHKRTLMSEDPLVRMMKEEKSRLDAMIMNPVEMKKLEEQAKMQREQKYGRSNNHPKYEDDHHNHKYKKEMTNTSSSKSDQGNSKNASNNNSIYSRAKYFGLLENEYTKDLVDLFESRLDRYAQDREEQHVKRLQYEQNNYRKNNNNNLQRERPHNTSNKERPYNNTTVALANRQYDRDRDVDRNTAYDRNRGYNEKIQRPYNTHNNKRQHVDEVEEARKLTELMQNATDRQIQIQENAKQAEKLQAPTENSIGKREGDPQFIQSMQKQHYNKVLER